MNISIKISRKNLEELISSGKTFQNNMIIEITDSIKDIKYEKPKNDSSGEQTTDKIFNFITMTDKDYVNSMLKTSTNKLTLQKLYGYILSNIICINKKDMPDKYYILRKELDKFRIEVNKMIYYVKKNGTFTDDKKNINKINKTTTTKFMKCLLFDEEYSAREEFLANIKSRMGEYEKEKYEYNFENAKLTIINLFSELGDFDIVYNKLEKVHKDISAKFSKIEVIVMDDNEYLTDTNDVEVNSDNKIIDMSANKEDIKSKTDSLRNDNFINNSIDNLEDEEETIKYEGEENEEDE